MRGQGGLSGAHGAAPGPPALLGPPRVHPRTPGLDTGWRPSPAGGADSATWWPHAGRNLNHRGNRAVQGDPEPAQASGPPSLVAGVPRGPQSSRVRSQAPLAVLGLPFLQSRRFEVHGSPVKQEEDTSQAGCGEGTRMHTHEYAHAPTHTHRYTHRWEFWADDDHQPRILNHENHEGSCLNPRTHFGSDISAGKGGLSAPRGSWDSTSTAGLLQGPAGLRACGSGQPTQGTPPAGTGVVRGAARSCEHPERPYTPPPGPHQWPPSQDRLHNCGAHAGLVRPLAPHLSSPSWQRRELEQARPPL